MCRAALVRHVSIVCSGVKFFKKICNTLICITFLKSSHTIPLLHLSHFRCKRYDKFPVAVLREAVPYDFGGIDIIDELPLPTPKDSKERKKEDKESTTQSTISGPEEPSLTNVVTAAEDFIKVLATVSTSQSSTMDSDKGESQSSEKKKRKNTGKKKKTGKKLKGKGKWRRRKQKAEAGGKVEEGTAVSTSGGKAEEIKALSNFISESQKRDQSSKNTDNVSDSGFELGGKEEPSNEVMKDEPVMDKETVFTSPTTVQKKPESTRRVAPFTPMSTTSAGPHRAKIKQPRKGWRKRSKTVPPLSKEGLPKNTTDVSVPTAVTIPPVAQQPKQQRPGSDVEKGKGVQTDGTPSVSPKGKRNRSKERGVKEGRKKRRKDGVASPAGAAPDGTAPMDHLKMIPLTGTPTVPTLSHRLDAYRGRKIARVASRNSTFSVQKVQKLQVKGLKDSKRKNVLSPSNENVLFVPPPPESGEQRSSPATSTPIGRPTVETERSLYTTVIAGPPSVMTERHGQTIRQQRKKKAKPSAVLQHAKQTPMTFTAVASKISPTQEFHLADKTFNTTTSATPTMSPVQLSIERAKAQFSRKKRRKAALSRQQR